jgi:hypothetical protein
MSMEDIAIALRTDMLAEPSVAEFFGDRIHIDDLPQNPVYPCIRVQVISDYPMHSQDGTGLGRALIQFNVVSPDRVEAGRMAEVLRSAYDGFRGKVGEFNARIFARNLTSDWIENAKVYIRMVEMDIGYVRQT